MNDQSFRTWPINNPWKDADDSTLREMWGKYTAGHIARSLEPPRSRNAVLGRAHRLDLPRIERSPISMDHERRHKAKKARRPNRTVVIVRKPKKLPSPRLPVPDNEPASLNIRFADRRPSQCSWIADEPTASATCCGHKVQNASSFCPFHHARFFVKPEGRLR